MPSATICHGLVHSDDPFFSLLNLSLPFRCSKLLQEGLSHHEISERVKEKAASENESIYGTLYGTLEEDE